MLESVLEIAQFVLIGTLGGLIGFLLRAEMYRREQERQHQRIMTPPRIHQDEREAD